jgi:hypothetical protein
MITDFSLVSVKVLNEESNPRPTSIHGNEYMIDEAHGLIPA